jgi:hypothetical protein
MSLSLSEVGEGGYGDWLNKDNVALRSIEMHSNTRCTVISIHARLHPTDSARGHVTTRMKRMISHRVIRAISRIQSSIFRTHELK